MQIIHKTIANYWFLAVMITLNCPDFFFRVIIVETIRFCAVLVLTQHWTYRDLFEACNVMQFLPFCQVLDIAIILQSTEPSKCVMKLNVPSVR